MNQILTVASATNQKKKKEKKARSGGTLEIKPVVIFFAIGIILFGIACIASGTYYLVQQAKANSENGVEPIVETQVNNGKVLLTVTHEKGINKVVYNWNNGQSTTLYGRGQQEKEEELILPVGNNTLYIMVEDSTGKQVQYEKSFEWIGADLVKPEITVIQDGNATIKITAKDETEMAYMEYYWEGEEPTRVDVTEEGQKILEERIEVREGKNTLYVVAVDAKENRATKEQPVLGATKPQIALNREGDTIIITATDEQGIQTVEYTLNGTAYSVEGNGQTQVDIRQDLVEGTNEFIITVTNVNALIAQGKAACDK